MLAGLRARAFVALGLARRAMTLGVKVLVTDGAQVLLVRHGYVPGWHLPGGGVERGETVWDAAAKELAEESTVRATGAMALFGFYRNARTSRFDHVALFVLREFDVGAAWKPNMEIVESRFWPLDALPDDTVESTRLRIAEVIEARPPSPDW